MTHLSAGVLGSVPPIRTRGIRLGVSLLLLCSVVLSPRAAAQVNQAPESIRLILEANASLDLFAAWDPIESSVYSMHEQVEVLQDPVAAELDRPYEAEQLALLLPDKPVAVGETWPLDEKAITETFLTQLHPGASCLMDTGAGFVILGRERGAYGCLRAYDDEWAVIRVRVHAEFRLSDQGSYYIPAQFDGTMLLDRQAGSVEWLRLAVPQARMNVDVNVRGSDRPGGRPGDRMGAADIGFVPTMELEGGLASDLDGVEWDHAISDQEAYDRLEACFYKFAEVEWLEFEEAVAEAVTREMPLHVVLMFGPLDSEAC